MVYFNVPRFVDCHVHIDKTGIVHRTGRSDGDLLQAIEKGAAERDAFTAQDVRERAGKAIARMQSMGTWAARTHVDWVTPSQPVAWAELLSLAQNDQFFLQLANLTPLDVYEDANVARSIAKAVRQAGSTKAGAPRALLGVYVRGQADQAKTLHAIFKLAEEFDLWLDFHVDESGDASLRGVDEIAHLAKAFGNGKRILLGHSCALALQPESQALATLDLVARSSCSMVALPTTNLFLQGRRKDAKGNALTPTWRGITLVQEALHRGINVCLASDNVRDAFYPYGDYDLQATARLGAGIAHLADAQQVLACVTTNPAKAMGLSEHAVQAAGKLQFSDPDADCIDWLAATKRQPL